MAKLRLNKILAQAGLTSRRGGDRLILEGRVAVNGTVTREPGTLAEPGTDLITVDGRPLPICSKACGSTYIPWVGSTTTSKECSS